MGHLASLHATHGVSHHRPDVSLVFLPRQRVRVTGEDQRGPGRGGAGMQGAQPVGGPSPPGSPVTLLSAGRRWGLLPYGSSVPAKYRIAAATMLAFK